MTDTNRFASLAIVVVNYGSSELLSQNLVPLARSTGARVVVVDNFTSAAEQTLLTRLARTCGWETVLSPTNAGFGAGMNIGVGRAIELGATQFLLLNPDATLTPSDLSSLLDIIEAHPLTLVSPTILRPDGSTWFAGSDLYSADGRIRSLARRDRAGSATIMPWLSGCCLVVTDELWKLVGGYDEDFFLYWEDVDLSRRVMDVGGDLRVEPTSRAIHAEGGTQSQGGLHSAAAAKSPVYYYYNIRNRLLFGARHLPPEQLRGWLRVTNRVSWEILLQGGRRQFLKPVSPVSAAWRGVRDGKRIAREALRASD